MIKSKPSTELALEDVQAMAESVKKLRSKLPALIALTSLERKRQPKLGEKKFIFMNDILAVIRNHSSILPPAFNAADFAKQVRLTSALHESVVRLEQLASDAHDTLLVVSGETLKASNEVYGYIKAAAGRSPELQAVALRLSDRFSRGPVAAAAPKGTGAAGPPPPSPAPPAAAPVPSAPVPSAPVLSAPVLSAPVLSAPEASGPGQKAA